jgi:hypothetical protein
MPMRHDGKAPKKAIIWLRRSAFLITTFSLLVGVNAVDLEHVLGDIQTDRGNLHVDGSLM